MEKKTKMGKKLAIKGHSTRGNEVIKLLEMLGGSNIHQYNGEANSYSYYISGNVILNDRLSIIEDDDFEIFNLEEFLEKYPFKVGGAIRFPNDMIEEIVKMEWDESSEDILCTSASGWKRFLRTHLENPKNNKQKETIMKYEVGNKVRIKSIDWYNENKDKNGIVNLIASSKGTFNFIRPMARLCGKVVTITRVDSNSYDILEDSDYSWTDEMIEGLVEEKFITTDELQLNQSNISLEKEMEWNLPQGYQFKDENGNVINTTKIVLEKKKREYPKTYEECAKIMNCPIAGPSGWLFNFDANIKDTYYRKIDILMGKFTRLLICRDAYWKIAGEHMGLDKPWEPDWNDLNRKYFISLTCDGIGLYDDFRNPQVLAFPTAEIREAFLENFKKEIEQCKELL